MKYKALLLALMTTFASAGVLAQDLLEEEDDRAKSFERLDVNNNGFIDEDEIFQVQDDHDFEGVEFDTLDEDENGKVSEQEWDNYFLNN
jgi:Ca2+-binding EF-hand superfamily protein